ncbi:hypothetical protein B0H16DRAFT_1550629 [Mycena metata]|uniref:Uncharacterized protein n=1 Tax=Mycena metata TaxID=1033252 RepID=A0AAD7N814_9AGAR|nr:hypothetical protein B0H16DRAFT_1550629 [Mycena metata]
MEVGSKDGINGSNRLNERGELVCTYLILPSLSSMSDCSHPCGAVDDHCKSTLYSYHDAHNPRASRAAERRHPPDCHVRRPRFPHQPLPPSIALAALQIRPTKESASGANRRRRHRHPRRRRRSLPRPLALRPSRPQARRLCRPGTHPGRAHARRRFFALRQAAATSAAASASVPRAPAGVCDARAAAAPRLGARRRRARRLPPAHGHTIAAYAHARRVLVDPLRRCGRRRKHGRARRGVVPRRPPSVLGRGAARGANGAGARGARGGYARGQGEDTRVGGAAAECVGAWARVGFYSWMARRRTIYHAFITGRAGEDFVVCTSILLLLLFLPPPNDDTRTLPYIPSPWIHGMK